MLVFLRPRVSSLWFSCGLAVSGRSCKTYPFRRLPSRLSCRFAWQGWHFVHSNLFDNVSKVTKLEEVSHEMLVFLRPRVSSGVSGLPVASPCLGEAAKQSSWEFSLKTWGHDVFKKLYFLRNSLAGKKKQFHFLRCTLLFNGLLFFKRPS